MTAKRFHYRIDEVGIYYYVCDNTKKGDDKIILEFDTKFDAMEVCELLNELNDECEVLEIENESLEDGATKYAKLYHESLKENEQLRKENKRLKELVEYFADELKIDLGESEECQAYMQ